MAGWSIELKDGGRQLVEGRLEVEGGAVKLVDADGELLAAWGPGAWVSVHKHLTPVDEIPDGAQVFGRSR